MLWMKNSNHQEGKAKPKMYTFTLDSWFFTICLESWQNTWQSKAQQQSLLDHWELIWRAGFLTFSVWNVGDGHQNEMGFQMNPSTNTQYGYCCQTRMGLEMGLSTENRLSAQVIGVAHPWYLAAWRSQTEPFRSRFSNLSLTILQHMPRNSHEYTCAMCIAVYTLCICSMYIRIWRHLCT